MSRSGLGLPAVPGPVFGSPAELLTGAPGRSMLPWTPRFGAVRALARGEAGPLVATGPKASLTHGFDYFNVD